MNKYNASQATILLARLQRQNHVEPISRPQPLEEMREPFVFSPATDDLLDRIGAIVLVLISIYLSANVLVWLFRSL